MTNKTQLLMDRRDYNPFPDVPGILTQMDIRHKLQAINSQGLFASVIQLALRNNKSLKSVLKMILDEYNESPSDVLDIIDEATIQQIKSLYYAKQ